MLNSQLSNIYRNRKRIPVQITFTSQLKQKEMYLQFMKIKESKFFKENHELIRLEGRKIPFSCLQKIQQFENQEEIPSPKPSKTRNVCGIVEEYSFQIKVNNSNSP